MKIEFIDNSEAILEQFQQAVLKALDECGKKGEEIAATLCPVATGTLRGSITHQVDPEGNEVHIGTNNEYAPYVELGTGKYYPGGRPGWWVYVEGGENKPARKDKDKIRTYTYEEALRIYWYLKRKLADQPHLTVRMTEGHEAHPYLKPAVADNAETYRKIIEKELKNG